MSAEQENFDQLRRLMAIKRHEQPHPGYFNDFSHQVVSRIRTGERAEDANGLLWEVPWLQAIWRRLETQPIFAAGLGAAACALLVWGVVYSERLDTNNISLSSSDSTLNLATGQPVASANAQSPVMLAATNPISGVAVGQCGSLFDEIQKPNVQLVRFPASGNN